MCFIGTKGREGHRPDYLDASLADAGYYVMRTSWTDDPNGIYVLLDAAHHWGGWHTADLTENCNREEYMLERDTTLLKLETGTE